MGAKMLNLDERTRVVDAFRRIHDAEEVADCFGISRREVYRLAQIEKTGGDLTPHPEKRGRKPKMSEEQRNALRDALVKRPDATLEALIRDLQLPVSVSQLSRIVRRMGYRVKKKVIHAAEQERADVHKKRKEWEEKMIPYLTANAERVVFLDESGTNVNMQPRYGRAIGGKRVVDSSPVNTPRTTTVISGMTVHGPVAYDLWQGGTTKARFIEYVKKVLGPALHPGNILVLDNLTAHHAKEVTELLARRHVEVVYLPPYSPDFNPIEEMWSKMKTLLREARTRLLPMLHYAVDAILGYLITPENCRGWFRHDGYLATSAPAY